MGRIKRPIATSPRELTGFALEDAARAFAKKRCGRRTLCDAALRYADAVEQDENGRRLPAKRAVRAPRSSVDSGEE